MVKIYSKVYLLILAVFAMVSVSCGSSQGSLPCIDVHKNYPEKEILITDIADISYVHLDAQDRDYLFSGIINYVTESAIVVNDRSSGSVLFFSRDGRPKSRFNHYGRGPGEYTEAIMIRIIYDEIADDVFLFFSGFATPLGASILVYSSTGEYKRSLVLPKGVDPSTPIDFDAQSLFFYDERNQFEKMSKREIHRSPDSFHSDYYRISKTDGAVLDSLDFPSNEADLTFRGPRSSATVATVSRVGKYAAGLYLCHADADTVFLYDGVLRPVICKTPLASDLDPKTYMSDFVGLGRYQFVQTHTQYNWRKIPKEKWSEYEKYYVHDTHTGEIFRQKISLPEYKGKTFYMSSYHTYYNRKETIAVFSMNMLELKDAYDAGRLSGELRALVGRLDEDVDNIYLFARFK